MPELPEVETLRRGLERHLDGREITCVRVLVPKMLKGAFADSAAFAGALRGRKVENVSRRGKHLIFTLDNGYYLLLHLKMRGQLLVVPRGAQEDKYLAAVFELDDGRELRFHDIWTWGEMRLLASAEYKIFAPLAAMGPEPLAPEWNPADLKASFTRRPRTLVKAALLDQTVVAGVGNIYADESLFRAGVHPLRAAGSLNQQEVARLHSQVRAVLTEATEGGGTASDNYADADRRAGCYVPRVYDRAGAPCPACGQALQRTKVTGRGTTYCPSCQC